MNTPILYFLPFLLSSLRRLRILSFSVAIIGLYHRTVRLGKSHEKKISLKHLGVRKRLFIILFFNRPADGRLFYLYLYNASQADYAQLDTAAYQTAATLLEQASGKVDISG